MAGRQSFNLQASLMQELKQKQSTSVTSVSGSQMKTTVTSSSASYSTSTAEGQNLAMMYAALEEQYAASEGHALSFTTSSSATSSQQYVSSHLELGSDEGTTELLDNSAARHKMSIRPQRRKRSVSRQRTDSTGESHEPIDCSTDQPKKIKPDSETRRSRSGKQTAADPSTKREAVVRELVETEEEFVADMEHVVNVYYRQMDHPSTPRRVSDQRDALFGPFKQIQEFHKTVLLEGLKYYANDPSRLGKTFLRLERDFDKHAQYYGAEPKSQELLKEDKDLREFFEEYSQQIGDTKRLSEYLKLPIQRINDFQVLIQDLISYSRELREDTGDLEKAHEFMLALPQRISDANFLENISGYRGSIHKLGRLLRHDWWTVTDSRGRSRERYLFLFKARILVTKVKRVSDDRNLFLLKDIIRIPDVQVEEHETEEPPSIDLIHSDARLVRYPLNLRSSSGRQVFQDWLFEIQKYSTHLIALQEHLDDDLQVDGPGETDNEAEDLPLPVKPAEESKVGQTVESTPEVKPEPKKVEPVETEQKTGEEDSAQIAKKIKGLLSLKARKPEEEQGVSNQEPEAPVEQQEVPVEQKEEVQIEEEIEKQEEKKEDVPVAPPSSDPERVQPIDVPMADAASEAPPGDGGAPSGPKFIRTIRGVFCEPGDKATFDCSIEGAPHCNVTWLRNNRPLDDRFADRVQMSESGKTHKLVIMNCRAEDSGQYTARASNSEGNVSCSAPLVVQTMTPEQREQMAKDNSPMFLVQLHDTELIEGSSVRFIIKVRGEPVPSVTFKKNGKAIVASDRIKILDDQSATGFFELVLNGVVKEDEGEYSCYALNRFGEAVCSANVSVTNDKDLFELLGAQGLIAPGDKPEFKWYKDGAPYDPEERFKVDFKEEEDTLALVFQGVKPEDAGLYTCVAATSTGKISCSAELTVQGAINHLLKEPEAPSFTVSLGDTEVSSGGSAMLELKYKGFPKPKMVWTKGDEVIKAGGRFRFMYEDEESAALIIKNVDAADAGVYKVTATNDLGEVVTEGNLLVKAPPKFKKRVQDMACMTDESFKMTVEVEGSPAPDIKWYKDGNLVIESERIKIIKESEESYALVIEKVVIEDSGAYSVVASNAIGQMSEFWHLVTNAKPSFVKGMLKDKEVEENGSINLQVQVFGNPLPSVKWVKDGQELVHDGQNVIIKQEGGNHTLTVNNAKRSDSGKYTCVITNPFGVQEEASDVHIRCKPEFTEPLTDQEVRVGSKDLAFTAKASVYPPPKVRWFLDEVEITEERAEYTIKSDDATGTYSLIAPEVTANMSGKYTIQLENDLGSAKSSAILTLQCAPRIEQSIENAVVDEGKDALFTFKCLALPEPTVKWFKDGAEVSASARVKITKESSDTWSLSIGDCVKEDTGTYTVKVANDLGEKELSASLTIQFKPKILEDNFELIDIYEEETIYYKVVFEGVPKPKAEWTLNGAVIEQTEHYVMTETENSYSLRVEEAALSDAGLYKLKLSNLLGECAKSAPVTVHAAAELQSPRIIKELHDAEVCKGNELVLHARIRCIPKPTVEWFKDGEPLKHNKDYIISDDELTHEYMLVLPVAKEVHGGKYTVKATNPNGTAESSAELTILIKPELTHEPEVIVNYFEDTTIEVKVVAIPAHEAKWLKNGAEMKISDRVTISTEESIGSHKLTLHKCDSTDEAVYTLVAKNTQGETRGDVKVKVRSEAPAFSEEPQSKHVRVGKTARLDGTVTGIPMPSVAWTKNGQPMPESERYEFVGVTKDGEFSLIIKDVVLDDFAEYGVKAASVIGEASATATLTESQIAPTIGDKLPVTTRGKEGELLKLSVLIDGSPRPAIKWFKDDVELVPDNDHIVMQTLPDGTVELLIEPADPDADNGQYKMVASNASGEASTHTEVDVKRKPRPAKITSPFEHHIQGVEQRPLKIEAKISGYPRPEVKWTKDGKQIRPGSHHTALTALPCGSVSLEIEKCTPEEAGLYSLHVSNDMGEDSCEATVEILPPPSAPHFSTPLFPVRATEGFNARLEAKVQGNPPPELAWFKDGHKIHGDYAKKPELDGRVRLDLRNVSRETDPGDYAVTAKNDEGEAKTNAKLEVRPRKLDGPEAGPAILTPPHDISVDEGSPIRLWALISGNPVPDVEWTRNGKPVDAARSFVWMDGDKVYIEIDKAVKKLDEGEYELILSNPSGKTSAKCKVTVWKVFAPPSFTQRFSDLQQLPNYDAKFMARIAGQPKPSVSWTFEDKPIAADGEKYKIKRDGEMCVLFIRDCSPGRAGRYTCIAKNSEGEDKCEANLEVVDRIEKREKEEAPQFLKKIGDCEVYEGMTAKFTACASGFPEPEYEWFRNGIRLHPSERIKMEREGNGLLRLSIKYVDEIDVGQYSIRIFNKVGEATCSGELIYDTLDSKPKKSVGDQYIDFDKFRSSKAPVPLADKPIIRLINDRYLTLSWKPSLPIGPRTPVTYAVEMKEMPDGDWKKIRSGIRGCCCDIRNLDPYLDYSFRIRVENEYGVSDPSPYNSTSRDRLNLVPIARKRFLEPDEAFNPEQSCYFPRDYDLDRPPHEGYKHAPRFLRQETEKQYGVKNQSASLFWYVYGYPKPHIKFYFNDELIEPGGRFDYSYTRNGQLTLFINKMLDRDAGYYEAVATNPYGEARQRVKLEIAEHPYFIDRPQECVLMTRKSGRVVCRIGGYPECEVKWYKDWAPLAPSSRVKLQHILPDTYIMSISDVITKDEGLYSIVARNPAGAISASAMVHVEELEDEFAFRTYQRNRNIKPKSIEVDRLFGNYYDIGDELGRGTQGVTYHAVERSTGRSFAAKMMTGNSEIIRKNMISEMEAMNNLHHERLIRLFDAYETPDNMTLVQELAAGGDLVDNLTKKPFVTESEVAHYVRQLLQGLKHMHDQNWAHLGLTPGDLFLSHPESDDLKIGDFGLARKIINTKLSALDFGMPEFVAPETANGQGVGLPADMWSVGVITYLFLSGISPFRGETDRDTLKRVQGAQINFDPDAFTNISADAKDFIAKLLVFHSEGRLTVDEALKHPWLKEADRLGREGLYEISTERLKTYYDRHYREWYVNASCRNWYRRRPLSSAFTHPSCMVYPPGEEYTPRATPVPTERRPSVKPEFKSLELPGVDTGLGSSESHYQYGPDTYLLQLRDVDFPVRLRHYMKVASGRSPSFAMHLQTSNPDFTIPVIHERRRFTDIMDEEIDDESRKARRQFKDQHGDSGPLQYYTPRRLKTEIGVRDEVHFEADAILEAKRRGLAPFFREKPKTVAMVDGEAAQLTCVVMGQPAPSVQWFRNDILIVPDRRVTITQNENGLSILKLNPAYVMDCGVFKAVARNKIGQTTAKCRLVVGDVPAAPDSPEAPDVSDTEILLRWKVPRHDGNANVLCYSLQQKKTVDSDWTVVSENIDHEFFLIRNLEPDTEYQFRLAARNRFGWSEKSVPTDGISTKGAGSNKVSVTRAMKYLQQLTESRTEPIVAETHEEEAARVLDYSIETEPREMKSNPPTDEFSFVAEINRGRFSMIAKCSDKEANKMFAAKIVKKDYNSLEELKIARTLCHERIAAVYQAYETETLLVTIMEKLQGIDVLSALSQRHDYTENVVVHIVSQVLDGLQYLHWRGLTHLDLQPDNVLLTSARSLDVKLCDFGCAQRVSKQGTVVEKDRSYLPFTAPEIINGEPAFSQSDIWSLGCLTYVLLSGVSPFGGENDEEIKQNITYVRYRFEPLYKEISMEAQRFIMFVFKRAPFKRPTTEECLEHRWFQPSEHMFKKRERAVFLGNRLKEFSDAYHNERMQTATKSDELLSSFGLGLGRSFSNQTDIFTTYE